MKLDTSHPADSVEFCTSTGYEKLFVCGTYKLIEAPLDKLDDGESAVSVKSSSSSCKRIGKCMLLKIGEDGEDDAFDLLQELEMPAIPDMKWSHHSPLLSVVDTEGHIILLKLAADERLKVVQSIQCRSEDILCLSLDWSDRRNSNNLGSIAVSSSDGFLSLLVPRDEEFAIERAWHAHDYEAWIAAWNYWDVNVMYSGGDDLKLKGWDIRQDPDHPIFINKRFDAGVTSIQSHPHIEHIVAVGSYDSSVLIFDLRKPLVPVTRAEVGGGAWRVKWHSDASRSADLLVACMHDGFKIARFSALTNGSSRDDTAWEIVKSFTEHESLAYGVDWSCLKKHDTEDTVIASCSFYDHVLHTWAG